VRGQHVDEDKLILAKQLRRNMTPAERILWERLRRNQLDGLHFRRQQVVFGFIADFYCHAAAIIVEMDGVVHDFQIEADAERTIVLESHGLHVHRVRNEEVFQSLDEVLSRIADICRHRMGSDSNSTENDTTRLPPLLGEGPGEGSLIMISISNVTKRYGPKAAVQDLSLHVPAGELFAFLGPNGAGKTTTIKMLCGLLFPSTGAVEVGGFDLVSHGDQARALISYVPDQPYLYEKLTGREFLQFTADLYGMPVEKSREKIAEVIDLFHLEDFADDLTERYSHGMRQRTVFAAALVHEPKLLIADEPTVGLDPKSIRELKTLLRQLAFDGMTVFLSTHTLDIAEELADRIGIIDHGRLIGCGTMTDLRKQAAMDGSLEDLFMAITEEAVAV